MGCLSRTLGAAVLLVGVGAGWWWWHGGTLPLPASVVEHLPAVLRPADSMSTAPARGLAAARWQPVGTVVSQDVQERIATLERRSGPAMVSLEPGELASFLVASFAQQLPVSAKGTAVTIVDDMVYVKAELPLEDFGGASILGPLAGALKQRDTIIIGGTFDLVERGQAQFRIREVIIGDFSVPRPLVPKLIARTRRVAGGAGISDDGYPIALPPYVGDVRIARDRITIYRAEPSRGPT